MGIFYLLCIFSSISILVSLFFLLYLLFVVREKKVKKIILIGLLIAINFRIIRPLIDYYFTDISYLSLFLGVLGHSLIGPLLYLYFESIVIVSKNNDFKKVRSLHLLYPIILTVIALIIKDNLLAFDLVCNFSLLTYLGIILFKFLYKTKQRKPLIRFDYSLIIMVSLFSMIFLAQSFIPKFQIYTLGTIIASFLITTFFVFSIKYPPGHTLSKNKKLVVTKEQRDIIKFALEHEEIYKTSGLTISSFSKHCNVPQYIIKAVIKELYNKTFPETINHFRIEEAKRKLSDPMWLKINIADLAYDLGYNTISSFYAIFKKETSMTPRKYQSLAM